MTPSRSTMRYVHTAPLDWLIQHWRSPLTIQAIKLHRDPIYFCNRAAAYCRLEQYDLAIQVWEMRNRLDTQTLSMILSVENCPLIPISFMCWRLFIYCLEDCRTALALDPNYSKAYGRMGWAIIYRHWIYGMCFWSRDIPVTIGDLTCNYIADWRSRARIDTTRPLRRTRRPSSSIPVRRATRTTSRWAWVTFFTPELVPFSKSHRIIASLTLDSVHDCRSLRIRCARRLRPDPLLEFPLVLVIYNIFIV